MAKEQVDEPAEEVGVGVRIAVPEFVADKDNPFASDLLDRAPQVSLLCDLGLSDFCVSGVI